MNNTILIIILIFIVIFYTLQILYKKKCIKQSKNVKNIIQNSGMIISFIIVSLILIIAYCTLFQCNKIN